MFYENDRQALEQAVMGNSLVYTPRKGRTTVRLLPTWKPGGFYFKKVLEHYVAAGDQKYFLTCGGSEGVNQDCPICDKSVELSNSNNPQSVALSESLRPRVQYLYNALIYNTPQMENPPEVGKVYILKVGTKTHKQIVKLDTDKSLGSFDVTNPKAGVNLHISRDGEGKTGTTYMVTPHPQRTSIEDDLKNFRANTTVDEIASNLNDLDAYRPPLPVEEVRAILKRALRSTSEEPTPTTYAGPFNPSPTAAPAVPSEGFFNGDHE